MLIIDKTYNQKLNEFRRLALAHIIWIVMHSIKKYDAIIWSNEAWTLSFPNQPMAHLLHLYKTESMQGDVGIQACLMKVPINKGTTLFILQLYRNFTANLPFLLAKK